MAFCGLQTKPTLMNGDKASSAYMLKQPLKQLRKNNFVVTDSADDVENFISSPSLIFVRRYYKTSYRIQHYPLLARHTHFMGIEISLLLI